MPHVRKAAMPVWIHNYANIGLYDYTPDGLKATKHQHHISDGPEDAPAFRHKVLGNMSAIDRGGGFLYEDDVLAWRCITDESRIF